MKSLLKSLLPLLFFSMTWSYSAELDFTQKELEWLKAHPVLRFGFDPVFAPYEWTDKGGMYTGIGKDYYDILEQRLGIEINIDTSIKTWTETLELAKSNEIDGITMLTPSSERHKYLNFTEPYLAFPFVIITLSDHKFITGLNDLSGLKVSVPDGYVTHEIMKKDYKQLDIVALPTIYDCLKAVSSGQVIAAVSDIPAAAYYIRKHNLANLKIAAPTEFEAKGMAIGVRKDWPELVGILQKGLDSISETERLQINDKWIGLKVEPTVDYELIWKIVFVFVTILAILLVWTGQMQHQKKIIMTAREEAIKANKALLLAKEHAEDASKAKSAFLANMSHEIRTPMNAILGFAEILQNKENDPKKSHYLENIASSGHSLLTLINDILDLSKIEASKMELQYTATSLRSIFEELKAVFEAKISDKGLEFHIQIDQKLPASLLVDPVRLRQVLVNLIGNAVKFTSEGHITLSVKCEEAATSSQRNLNIMVEDTGAGIPEDSLDDIFGVFEQAKGQRIAKYGGTGLGLAISQRLVEMMNGKIKVTSQLGKGTTFTIDLPNVEVAAIHADVNHDQILPLEEIVFEKAAILIVDDIDYNREMLAAYLNDWEFTFSFAANGKEAIEQIQVSPPDIILLDMSMPEMDGYETIEIIRNNKSMSEIPIIAVTASALKQEEDKISKICDGYLRKPVSKSDLIQELSRFLPSSLSDFFTGS